ncbi:MAG: KPN_02809 family neutral zinc metallopeptidase [Nocardioides sp.]
MRYNPRARLDTRRMRNAGGGGMGGGAGGRLPIPGGVRAGGGVGTLVIIILYVVLTQCGGGGGGTTLPSQSLDTSRVSSASGDSSRYADCKTGADANNSTDCARVADENSLYSFWSKELGSKFQPEQAVETFNDGVGTGCGQASADMGPFYCPQDHVIYLDSTFFKDILQGQLNGPSGAFVEPYVLAHEYGHHIQFLLGTMSKVKTQQGPNSDSVRLELQADCYAGMWTKNATTTTDSGGEALIQDLTDQDISTAIAAAKSVGDDRIQSETTGRVNPDQWTHGSAAARVKWFQTGYQQGSLDACDTFKPATVE